MRALLSLLVAAYPLFATLSAQIECLRGNCYNGYSVCVFPSGAKYEGHFLDGRCHGEGTLYFTNGDRYVGNWKNHYREGQGRFYFANGDEYEGYFHKNQLHGQGRMRYANGNRYEGDWKNNNPNGYGLLQYANGDRYEGTFKDGARHGLGAMYYADQSKYDGEWRDDQRHGQGALVYPDGMSVKGHWANGEYKADWAELGFKGDTARLRNCNLNYCEGGNGKFSYRNGAKFVGEFSRGVPSGNGTVYYRNGDRYDGGWQEDAPQGKGVMYYANGRVVGALWEGGRSVRTLFSENEDFNRPGVAIDYDREVKIWAVIIGAARYSHMPPLRYTDDDAYQIYAFLKSPEGGALPDNQLRLLIDEEATRANILNAMRSVFLRADENDVIMFYFSGHGLKGAFLPVDFDGYNNRLNHGEIREMLNASRAKHKIVLADACHSGSILAMKTPLNIVLEKYYQAFEETRGGTALLLSSKGEEYSLEDGGLRSGVFSHFLVRGLKGEADRDYNDIVTIQELFDYVYERVRGYTDKVQTPVLMGAFDQQMPVAIKRR